MRDVTIGEQYAITTVSAFLFLAFSVGVGFSIGRDVGRNDAAQAAREARECDCDQVKSCVFAPGIVGVRSCRRYDNRWDRCEPDPQYRVIGEIYPR